MAVNASLEYLEHEPDGEGRRQGARVIALRHAWRALARNPRLTLPVVLLLGLAIGASGAAFSLVHSILLRRLPYQNPDRLVFVWSSAPEQSTPDTIAWPDFLDWRQQSRSFAGLAAFNGYEGEITGGGEPELVPGAAVTSGFFELLGVRPLAGRFFAAGDPRRPEPKVVVLSHGLWKRRFGGSPDVLGRTFVLSGEAVQIIGIAPPGMRQPEPFGGKEAELWVPLPIQSWMDNRAAHALRAIGRLRRGVELPAAQAEMGAIAHRIATEHRDAAPDVLLVPLHRQLVGDLRPGLLMLMAAMAALLLAACANAGNQVLVYRLHRQRDVQMREALGAGRGLLAAQAVWEGLLLGLGGGTLGLILGAWAGDLLAGAFPVAVPGIEAIRFDLAAAAFTVAVAAISGVLLGAPSVLRLMSGRRRQDGGSGLQSPAASGRRAAMVRGALLVIEVALALPLVAAAGLLAQSLLRLTDVDPGFRAAHVTTFSLRLPVARYAGRPQQRAFFSALAENLASAPGVRAAAVGASLPLSGANDEQLGVIPEGPRPHPDLSAHYELVSLGYFATLGVPIAEGRGFGAADVAVGASVAIVSRSLARLLWPGRDPLGRRVSFDYGVGAEPHWMTVVGLAGDVRQEGLANPVSPVLYRPLGQSGMESMAVVVRTAPGAADVTPELRAIVHRLDPSLALADLQPFARWVERESARLRFLSQLVEAVALVTLLVAALGIVSLMSYLNRLRRRELAIRVALGARPAEIVRCLVWPAARLLAAGCAVGLAATLAVRPLLASVVFGIGPADPWTVGGACLLILALGLAAAYLPARDAARVNAREALQGGG